MDRILQAPIDDRQRIGRELDEKALRSAVWIAMHQAQRRGFHEVAGQLTSIYVCIADVERAA